MTMRMLTMLAAAGCCLLPVAPAFAQAACDRGDLETMVRNYLAAQTSGEPLKVPFADFTQLIEQGEIGSMSGGILSTPLRIELSRSLYDVPTCTTFTELVVTDPAHPYVVVARLQYAGRDNPIAADRVNDVELVVADADDAPFDAAATLRRLRSEGWDAIPAAARTARPALIAAADAYLDALGERPAERRYVVDDGLGAVAVISRVGADQLPVSHLFRVEQGRARLVHAVGICRAGKCAATGG